MAKRPDIVQFITAPSGLGQHRAFQNLDSWQAWLTFLRALYAIPFQDEAELARFTHHTERIAPPSAPAREAWVCCGRRGGKSFVSAVIACYESLTGRYAERLSGMGLATCYIIAVDRNQANHIYRYCLELLRIAAPDMIARSTRDTIELKNGMEISIRAGNYASLRGAAVALALIDECAYLRDENGHYSQPVQEIVKSLMPALIPAEGDDPGGKIIFLSTPRQKTGMFFERFEAAWGKSDTTALAWRGGTQEMHPNYISQEQIDADLRADRGYYKSEWLAQWQDDASSLFDPDKLSRAMKDHRPLPFLAGRDYFGFIDSSEGRHDSFTIAVGYRDQQTGHVIVCKAKEWLAPFSPQEVVPEVVALAREYHLGVLWSDAHAVGWIENAFIQYRIRILLTKQSKSAMYQIFFAQIQLGEVWLPDYDVAERQFLSLERVENRDGTWRVDHPSYGGARDDLANAIAGLVSTVLAETKVWSSAEMEAKMPRKSAHGVPEHEHVAITRGRSARETAEACRREMEDFLVKDGGCSRIVR